MDAPFVGDVVFLFTDIEGSTRLWEARPEAMSAALAEHFAILRDAIAARGGRFLKDTGDGAIAAFGSARDAVVAAVAAQRELSGTAFDGTGSLKVRMGLDAGWVPPGTERYEGTVLNRTARIVDAAHGGQVLVSDEVRSLLGEDDSEVVLSDLGPHRLKDLREPARLYQAVAEGIPERFPPLRTLEGFAHNLPAQLSSFVGRDRDVTAVTQRLERSRVVTLIGPGGVGKTRLAIQCAAELVDQHPDGVWLAELARVTEPELVAQTVATSLRLADEPGIPARERLRNHLASRRSLVILDNCEHVIDAAAALVEHVASAAPDVRFLATSREALNVGGEALWNVAPLDLDDEDGRPAAVDLFLERARSVDPDLTLDAGTLADVHQLCARLDGLPLAIELAAARVRTLSVGEIAERLDDRFRLLTGGSRTAVPRQRTLEGAVAWSYELLTVQEQRAFQDLSVFVGGWTLGAAEHVLGRDALELVSSLVDRSLLSADHSSPEVRYDMLETIRAYGRERLIADGRAEQARQQHLAWSLALAGEAAAHLDGPDQLPWLDRTENELGNLRAAMEWSLESGEAATGLRIAASLYRYWFMRAVREGRQWLERLITVADDVDDELRARSRYAHGGLLQVLGEYDRAAEVLGRSVDAFRRTDNDRGLAYAIHHLARAEWGLADPDQNLARFEEALALFRDVGDPVGEGLTMLFTNLHAIERGEFDRAEQDAQQLAAIFDRIGAAQLIAHGLECRGWTAAIGGRTDQARDYYRRALTTYEQLQNPACGAHALEGAAQLLSLCDRIEDATRVVGATTALRDRIAVPPPPYENLFLDDVLRMGEDELAPDERERLLAEGAQLDLLPALRRAGQYLSR